MIAPITLSAQWITFDLPALLLLSGMLFIFTITKRVISRLEGSLLLFGYLVIVTMQVLLAL